MEGILNNLSLATYNCRGFKSSLPDVQKLLNDYQIIFLQETCLAKQQQICKGSLCITEAGVLLHETVERRHLGR